MKKRDQKKAIADMAGRLSMITRPHQFGTSWMWHDGDCPMLRDRIAREELRHRRGHPGRRAGCTKSVAVDLFICQYLLNYRTGRRSIPLVKDVGHLKLSIYHAWNVWSSWKKEIRAAVTMAEARQWLDDVSYADLMDVAVTGRRQ